MLKRILRTVGLWMLIIGDAACMALAIWKHNIPLIILSVLITVGVCGIELWGVLIGWKQPDGTYLKNTLSQMFWRWGKDIPTIAYVWIFLFMFSMVGLALHLIAF